MRSIPREWTTLTYLRASVLLDRFRRVQGSGLLDALPYKVQALRRRDLQQYLEGRQGELFCYGVGRAIGAEISFALYESADYDIVARYQEGNELKYIPVQLKELVPSSVNPKEQLQDILDKLARKLPDSKDLVVAIHVNRDISDLRPADLRLPSGLGQLWLFGAKDRTQKNWYLIGDLLKDPNLVHEFRYPNPQSRYWTQSAVGPYRHTRDQWIVRASGPIQLPSRFSAPSIKKWFPS